MHQPSEETNIIHSRTLHHVQLVATHPHLVLNLVELDPGNVSVLFELPPDVVLQVGAQRLGLALSKLPSIAVEPEHLHLQLRSYPRHPL